MQAMSLEDRIDQNDNYLYPIYLKSSNAMHIK